jgi:predicted permease
MWYLINQRRLQADLAAELEFHREMKERDLGVADGDPREVDPRVRRALGNVALAQDEARDVWLAPALQSLLDDLKHACRSLVRTPGVTGAILTMVALGVGANAAMYGLLSELFLRAPPHIQSPNAVYRLYIRQAATLSGETFTSGFMDWEEFSAVRDDTTRFSQVAGYTGPTPVQHGRGQAAEELQVSTVTGGFFELLGARPSRGRLIAPSDDQLAAPPVAVIAYQYWRSRFPDSRDAVGAAVTFDDVTYTIIGIAPPGFSGPDPNATDVWLPLQHAATATRGDRWRRSGSGFAVRVLVRLASDTTESSAGAAATAAVQTLRAASKLRRDMAATVLLGPIVVARGPSELSSDMRLPVIVGGLATVVLVIAIANVANLLMLRAIACRREIAVRSALGGAGWQVARFFVLESLVLALASGVLAVGVAAAGGHILRETLLPRFHWAGYSVNWAVLSFTLVTTLTVGLTAGLFPALLASRLREPNELRGAARVARASGSPIRSMLLVLQAALSLVLIIGAMVFYRSFDAARQVDIGYARDSLLTIVLDELNSQRPTPRNETTIATMEDRVRVLPGVVDVAQGTNTPLGGRLSVSLRVDGLASLPRMSGPYVSFVTPNYFDVAGLAILRGRAFTLADRIGAPRVAIVNDRFARLIWPDRDAIGGCLYIGKGATDCATVIGVAESPREGLAESSAGPGYFIPLAQAIGQEVTSEWATRRRTLIVQTTGDPGRLTQPALVALAELFPELPRNRVRTLTETFAPRLRVWKVGAGLFTSGAILALLLAGIGLYATIGFVVHQREFEFGIRRALGAQTAHLLRLVLAQGLGLAIAGVIFGVLVSLWAGKFVAPLLFEDRSPRDPVAFGAAATILLVASLAASLLPARRAATVNPRQALQAE